MLRSSARLPALLIWISLTHPGPVQAGDCGQGPGRDLYPAEISARARKSSLREIFDDASEGAGLRLSMPRLRPLLECLRCFRELTDEIKKSNQRVSRLEDEFVELRGEFDRPGALGSTLFFTPPSPESRVIGSPWSRRPPINLTQKRKAHNQRYQSRLRSNYPLWIEKPIRSPNTFCLKLRASMSAKRTR